MAAVGDSDVLGVRLSSVMRLSGVAYVAASCYKAFLLDSTLLVSNVSNHFYPTTNNKHPPIARPFATWYPHLTKNCRRLLAYYHWTSSYATVRLLISSQDPIIGFVVLA